MSRPPTLEDVAREAGVSRATVSRVVREDGLVAPDKVALVSAAVRKLGYVPNRAARSLVTRRKDAVAVLVPEADSRIFSDPFFASAIAAVASTLDDAALQLLLVMGRGEGSDDRLRRFLRDEHADGVVVMSHHANDHLAEAVAAARLPAVFVGRPGERAEVPFVDLDNVEGGRLAAGHLVGRGRRRIATITGPQDMVAAVDRLAGWREVMEANGLPGHRIAHGAFTLGSGVRATEDLLAAHPDLDAIFVANDLMAMGCLRQLARAGRRVPDDVAVVGFDDISLVADAVVPLTTVTNPVHDLARRATELLLDLVEGRPVPRATMLTPTLVVRASA